MADIPQKDHALALHVPSIRLTISDIDKLVERLDKSKPEQFGREIAKAVRLATILRETLKNLK